MYYDLLWHTFLDCINFVCCIYNAKSITNQNKVHCKHTLKCKTITSIIVKVVFSKVLK